MSKLMAAIAGKVINTVRSAVGTSNFVNSTESAFVSSARAKSLNQIS